MPEEVIMKEIGGLKREIKRAKLFEVQRLVRRLRQLANKKGSETQIKKNQRKVERFEKELEFLKDVGVDEIARRIASKNGEDGLNNNQAIKDNKEDPSADYVLQEKALDRVVNSTKIKEFMKRVDASRKDFGRSDEKKDNKRAERQQNIVKDKSKDTTNIFGLPDMKALLDEEAEVDDNRNFVEGKLILKRKRKPENEKGKDEVSDDKLSHHVNDEDKFSSDGETSRVKTKQKFAEQKFFVDKGFATEPLAREDVDNDSDGFISNSDLDASDFEEDEEGSDSFPSPELKFKGLESCFVGTMSGAKGDKGLKGRKKQRNGKGRLGDRKGKRNRRGQRARQQMWEKIHGKRAKHLYKNNIIKPKEYKEDRKQTSKVKGQHSVKRKSDDESLHPSWEAVKRKRLQETVKVEFKGQKIIFDDSDLKLGKY
ncbi:unnamed protein product [Porites evermanni]|uniref:Serum response factor-binding protein 1 n=1 Tax=Porites evermanni TaxID=104178 RepID=A0ABN8M358_9CNID|nr:unnamed protein product [Porites evermanni]